MTVKIKECFESKDAKTRANVLIDDEIFEVHINGNREELCPQIDEEIDVELDFVEVTYFAPQKLSKEECGYFKTNRRDVIGIKGQVVHICSGGQDVIYDVYVGPATCCLCLISTDIGARKLREGDGLEVHVRGLALYPCNY